MDIKRYIAQGKIKITPELPPDQFGSCSVDFRLGNDRPAEVGLCHSPSAALGRDTTMLREILDRTAERVGKEMTNQPAVEAELRSLIGTLYQEIGNYDRAEEMHRAALS